jgi:hypothetical protein
VKADVQKPQAQVGFCGGLRMPAREDLGESLQLFAGGLVYPVLLG